MTERTARAARNQENSLAAFLAKKAEFVYQYIERFGGVNSASIGNLGASSIGVGQARSRGTGRGQPRAEPWLAHALESVF